MNLFNGMFGKVAPGMCRMSMSGAIAVKTSNGYKSYNVKTGRLTNCDNFVFNIGDEMFYVIPTNKVSTGDIILVGGKPKCVITSAKGSITVLNYEDSTIENIVPERHMFMGNVYFYGKIVSMFGNLSGSKGMKSVMKFAMMSDMMKGSGSKGDMNMSSMVPFMLMGGEFNDIFSGLFDDDDSADEDSDDMTAIPAGDDKEDK